MNSMNSTDSAGERTYTSEQVLALLMQQRRALKEPRENPVDPSVQEFFADQCTWDDQGRIRVSQLFQIYWQWCRDKRKDGLDVRRFGHALTKMGFWVERGSGGVRYRRGLSVNGIKPARDPLVPKWLAVTDDEIQAILGDL